MNFAEKGPINQKVFSEKSRYPEGGRACYFLYHYFCCTQYGFTHPVYPHTGFIAATMKDHLVKWEFYSSDKDMNLIFERFYENPEELEAMENYLNKTSADGVKKLSAFASVQLSDRLLKEAFENYFESYWSLMVTAGTLRTLDRMVVKNLRKVFGSSKNADQLIALSAVPAKPAYSVKEELAILYLAAKINTGLIKAGSAEYENEIDKIKSEFCFGPLGYFNEKPKNFSAYDAGIKEALKNNPQKMLDDKEKIFSKDESARSALAETLDENGRKLMKMAAMAAYLKDLYKYSVNKIQYHAEFLFSALSKNSGKPIDFIKDLHPKEILDLLNGVMPDEKNVLERVKHNVVLAIPGQMETLLGADAEKFEKVYLSLDSNSSKMKEFKGRIASKGYGRGVVKIVRSPSEFNKLNASDVLVVTNTSPDFVAIMKKAAAIIAEDGGITAHVSVISREFGIPCVVGIRDATDIFQDGDMVEVDAERGVVKIIKRGRD